MLKKVLLLYKKSAYSIYFLERKIALAKNKNADIREEMRRFQKAHEEHNATLVLAEHVLRRHKIPYTKCARGQKIDYRRYAVIITVGGDGTVLEAAKNIKNHLLIGINSAPSFSVGKLCAAGAGNLEDIIRRFAAGNLQIVSWPRLRLKLSKDVHAVDCLNDVLICHRNPAAMSRYRLKIGAIEEEQRSSGLWVATAAGSSGAIRSAGGKLFPPQEKKIQYMPRELYDGFKKCYRLKGGVLQPYQTLAVTSLMRQGMIFADGTHHQLEFSLNAVLKISLSPYPLRTIKI